MTAAEKTQSLDELFDSGLDRDTMIRILILPGFIAFLASLMGLQVSLDWVMWVPQSR